MIEFEKLNNTFNNEIISSKLLLKITQEQYEKCKRLHHIVDNIYNKKTDEFDGKLKKETKKLIPELAELINLIDSLRGFREFINQKRYSLIPERDLRKYFEDGGLAKDDINAWFSLLGTCKKLEKMLRSVKIKDDDLDENCREANRLLNSKLDICYLNSIDKLMKALNHELMAIYGGDLNIIVGKISDLEKMIDDISVMSSHFDKNGLIKEFSSNSEIEHLYEWLKDKMDQDLLEKIIKTIKDNKIVNDLSDTITKEEITFDNLNLSKFNLREKEIINNIKELYNHLIDKIKIRKKIILLGNREDNYLQNNKYNWDIILSDIEDNLLPNIYDSKDDVLHNFEIIIKLANRRNDEIHSLTSIIEYLDLYLKKLKTALKYGDKYDTKYDYLIEEKYDKDSELFGFQVSYEYVCMGYYLKHTVEGFYNELKKYRDNYQRYLDNDLLLDGIKIDKKRIDERFNSIMLECNMKILAYQESEQSKFKDDYSEEKEYGQSVNLVFCIDSFDLPSEGHRRELKETLKDFTGKSHKQLKKAGNSRRDQLATIKRAKDTNGERVIEYNDSSVKPYCKYFLPYRYAGQADYRTGLIHFNKVHPVIKKKLQERYNLSNHCGIYGVFMVIFAPGANHTEYVNLEDYIKDHMDEIDKLGEMFSDPNIDINILYRIIDDGINLKEELVKDKVY